MTSQKTAAKETKFGGNLLRFVRARAHVRALMTREECAVWVHNTITKTYRNDIKSSNLGYSMSLVQGQRIVKI